MKSQIILTFFFFQILFYEICFSQNDTLVSYDVRTKQIESVKNTHFDTTKRFENTLWNVGTLNGISELSLLKPTDVFPGSGFTDYRPAQQFFPVSNYPQRTTVKLFKYRNGIIKQEGSGVMISKDLVLTASHCVYLYNGSDSIATFHDSLLAIPAFDNGKENQFCGKSISAMYYLPKSNFQYFLSQDVAIIKLREPIGLKTGWVGISFFEEDSSLKNKVFHKFSYPGTVDLTDSTRVFNGDTLYYNYGTLDLIEQNEFGYNISAIPGQSGSSLIYTNNESYYSVGVLNWMHQSRHYRFSKEMYYAFKGIIESSTNSIKIHNNSPVEYSLSNAYPNPFNPTTQFEFQLPIKSTVSLRIYDIIGREVEILVNELKEPGKYSVQWNAPQFASGMYLAKMTAGSFLSTKKIMLVK